jgi:hypothetical protein
MTPVFAVLTVVFVTISGILANSLRHRSKELKLVSARVDAKDVLIKDRQTLIDGQSSALRQKNEQIIRLEAFKANALKGENDAREHLTQTIAERDIAKRDLTSAKDKLKGAYRRVGKRFERIS